VAVAIQPRSYRVGAYSALHTLWLVSGEGERRKGKKHGKNSREEKRE